MTPRKLKRVIIKEEFVALTGDVIKAVILNQFVYWSERVADVDRFLVEERERALKYAGEDINVEPQNGWIYKKAEDLSEETMLGLAKSNIRTHIKALVEAGWLMERRNPKYAWDRTLQYRVDFVKLRDDLQKIGYDLDGYIFDEVPSSESIPPSSVSELRGPEMKLQSERNDPAIPETIHRDIKEYVCMDARTPEAEEILATLADELRSLPVNDHVTVYDAYYDAIYAMLVKSFADRLEPDIIRIAAEIYAEKQIDQPGLTIRNPVGFFRDAYIDAIRQWKARRYRREERISSG